MRLRRRVLTGCDESSWTFSTDRRPQTADRRRRPPLWTVDDNGGGVSMRSAAGTVRTIARPQAARVALLGSRSYRIGSDRLRFDLRRRSPMDGAARFAHSLDHEEQNGSHVGVVKKWPPRHPQPRQLRPIYRTLLHFDIRPRPLAPQPKINLALLRPSIALVRDRVLYSVLVSSQHTRAPSFSLASPRLVSPITQLSPHPIVDVAAAASPRDETKIKGKKGGAYGGGGGGVCGGEKRKNQHRAVLDEKCRSRGIENSRVGGFGISVPYVRYAVHADTDADADAVEAVALAVAVAARHLRRDSSQPILPLFKGYGAVAACHGSVRPVRLRAKERRATRDDTQRVEPIERRISHQPSAISHQRHRLDTTLRSLIHPLAVVMKITLEAEISVAPPTASYVYTFHS
ncbi:hypothetical protein V9T40_007429 [Parthenolecanium corni]|uniref:Uncharacterized protein n=1 Tax=Parthenolecanium corni TaxID=536013 RepID=A0AAN9YAR8_9HEMI